MTLLDPAFWRAIAWTLVRTALAGLVPFLPGLTSDLAGTWPLVVGTVGLLLIATIATSLAGIVTPDTATWWEVLASRGLRQFAQFFAAGLIGAVLLSDVDWITLLQGAVASALSTVLLAALTIIPGADSITLLPPRAIVQEIDYTIPDGTDPGEVLSENRLDDLLRREGRGI